MTTGLSYSGSVSGTASFVGQLAELAVVPQTDTNFQSILPAAVTYAENRIYRDLDLLATVAPFYSSAYGYAAEMTPGYQYLSFPVDTYMTIQGMSVITGSANVITGVRTPLTPVTREFLSNVYGDPSATGQPQYFAIIGQGLDPNTSLYSFQVQVAPAPNAAYPVDVYGTFRPPSLSAVNPTTWVSLYLPDLMLLAAMVYVSGYQRNWSGASANDPQMPLNYETQYTTLLKSATVEEGRKKFQSSGWTAMSPTPVATPSRG